MDVSVSETMDQKTYLRKFEGGLQPLSPPWIRLWSQPPSAGPACAPHFEKGSATHDSEAGQHVL